MTIKEIQKDRILSKKTNPVRSGALEGLLDRAKKLAKADNVEVTEAHIIASSKVLQKENMKTIAVFRDDFSDKSAKIVDQYFKEIEIYKEFLPVQVTEEKLRETIVEYIAGNIEEKSMKSMGKVMKMVQYTFGDSADRGLASSITKEQLS